MCVYVHFGQLTELRHGILKLLRIHEHRDPGNYLVEEGVVRTPEDYYII